MVGLMGPAKYSYNFVANQKISVLNRMKFTSGTAQSLIKSPSTTLVMLYSSMLSMYFITYYTDFYFYSSIKYRNKTESNKKW